MREFARGRVLTHNMKIDYPASRRNVSSGIERGATGARTYGCQIVNQRKTQWLRSGALRVRAPLAREIAAQRQGPVEFLAFRTFWAVATSGNFFRGFCCHFSESPREPFSLQAEVGRRSLEVGINESPHQDSGRRLDRPGLIARFSIRPLPFAIVRESLNQLIAERKVSSQRHGLAGLGVSA